MKVADITPEIRESWYKHCGTCGKRQYKNHNCLGYIPLPAQRRPPCPLCGRWKRRDHNCPVEPRPRSKTMGKGIIMPDNKECTVCYGLKVYINSRGVNSGIPCNHCDPEGYAIFVAERKKR